MERLLPKAEVIETIKLSTKQALLHTFGSIELNESDLLICPICGMDNEGSSFVEICHDRQCWWSYPEIVEELKKRGIT
jgi:hypothetical protein